MTGLDVWVQGARPRMLPAAVVLVAIGTAAQQVRTTVEESRGGGSPRWWCRSALADRDELRQRPQRRCAWHRRRSKPAHWLVGGRLASARAVKVAAFASFGVAALAGLMLAGLQWAGGCSRPARRRSRRLVLHRRLASLRILLGFGELFVFVFGLVATAGPPTCWPSRSPGSIVCGLAAGCLACALLVVNNLRDIPGDTIAGKKTLAVRIGDTGTRGLYVLLIALAFLVGLAISAARPPALLALLAVPIAVPPVRAVLGGAKGRALIPVLGGTGRIQLVFGALLTLGLALGA
ncbi:MAG: UbiA family prenyltransferase [Ilumatobacteraceae bacterium]